MKRAVALINRIQFVDLARAVAQPRSDRKDWLRTYLNRKTGNFPTYEQFRKATPTIYGVQRVLDPSPLVSRDDLERNLIKACKGNYTEMNVEAALTLFDLVRRGDCAAYDHAPKTLKLGLDRHAAIRIDQYVVRNDELIFQFPYPRRERLSESELRLMMSMIHYAYAQGDFAAAQVEIADLSAVGTTIWSSGERLPAAREPRIVKLGPGELIDRRAMEPEIQTVHDLLLEIGSEPDEV